MKLAGGRQRFCSKDCSRLFYAKKKKGICIVCGREYSGRSDNKGFCSRKCVARYSVENKQNVCVYCGSEFNGKGKYCGDDCRVIGRFISRAEALRIARKILEQAERERLIFAEYEAARGIQWENHP